MRAAFRDDPTNELNGLTSLRGKESEMRTVRFALYTFLAACSALTAWAQYGLYGSPETLSVPQQPPAAQPYSAAANYPTTAAPMAQPAPTPAYYPASTAGVLSAIRRRPRRTIRSSRRFAIRRSRRPVMYQPYQPAAHTNIRPRNINIRFGLRCGRPPLSRRRPNRCRHRRPCPPPRVWLPPRLLRRRKVRA